MSRFITVPCNESVKEIGVFNKVQVSYVPVGIELRVSFVETPKTHEIYPLSDSITLLNEDETIAEAERCFVHITGASAEDVQLIASNITSKKPHIDFKKLNILALEATTKSAIETLATTLDKSIEPYVFNAESSGTSSATALTTVLSKNLTCDKIFSIITLRDEISANDVVQCGGYVYLDGICVSTIGGRSDSNGRSMKFKDTLSLENVNGKLLEIKCLVATANKKFDYLVKEYILKP